jgi:pyruvate/2-oxoglutarate dehydrogenase complex dihydrolipoamide dehydrogenase (E3) component/uncharacterized membrane protein YdjX (TVP38/TMEM64 family)
MNKKLKLIFLFVLIAISWWAYYFGGLNHYFSFASLKNNQSVLIYQFEIHKVAFILSYAVLYIVSTAISFPGASLLTIAAGAIMGIKLGVVVSLISSTIGSVFAFWMARYFMREEIESRYAHTIYKINEGIKKEGAYYLFTLRLIPIFPFFMVNLLLGITSMSTWTYTWVSFVGMFPGSLLYVYAGSEIAKLNSLRDILSLSMLIAFTLIGVAPFLLKWMLSQFKYLLNLKKYKKPKSFDFNLIVIGGGAAGLVSSLVGSTLKAKVLLVEKEKMGGECLNTGCVPSKALIKVTRLAHSINNSKELGLDVNIQNIEFSKIMDHVRSIISKIAPHDSKERYQSLGVECVKGQARIHSPYEVEVDGRIYTTKNIIISSGAQTFIPEIKGLTETSFLTSETIWNLNSLPKDLLVIGGGAIGCELGQAFARLGSRVVIVESHSSLLSREDEDMSSILKESLQSEGIEIFLNSHIEFIDGANKVYQIKSQDGLTTKKFDQILIACGKKGRVEGLGLEALCVELDARQKIVTDEYLRVKGYPNIYACGDVVGSLELTNASSLQGWIASVNSLFGIFVKFKTSYDALPRSLFTEPELASVGLNEKEASAKGIAYEAFIYDLAEFDRAIIDGKNKGRIKVLCAKDSAEILGACIVGPNASENIHEFAIGIQNGLGLKEIFSTSKVYPSYSEYNKYLAGVWKKQTTHPLVFKLLEFYHRVRR